MQSFSKGVYYSSTSLAPLRHHFGTARAPFGHRSGTAPLCWAPKTFFFAHTNLIVLLYYKRLWYGTTHKRAKVLSNIRYSFVGKVSQGKNAPCTLLDTNHENRIRYTVTDLYHLLKENINFNYALAP